MSLFRCSNCGKTFEAKRPACAACGIDPAKDPRAAGIVHRLETIHYDPPHDVIRHRGKGHLACDPKKPVAGNRATGEPSVVNCARCRETDSWRKAYAETGEPEFREEDDEPIEFDKATIS